MPEEEKFPLKGVLVFATFVVSATAATVALLRFHEEYGRAWLQRKLKEGVP